MRRGIKGFAQFECIAGLGIAPLCSLFAQGLSDQSAGHAIYGQFAGMQRVKGEVQTIPAYKYTVKAVGIIPVRFGSRSL